MSYSELDIIDLRKKLGVTQGELAKLLSVHIRTVQNYEAGGKIPKTKYELLCKLITNGNTDNPDTNKTALATMEDRITALEQLLQKRDEEIISLTTQIVKLKKELLGVGKQYGSGSPEESEGRRETG